MNTQTTTEFCEANNVKVLIADMTDYDPQLDEAIVALGNTGKTIPFYAVFPANGGPPITFSDVPLTQGALIAHLQKALDVGASKAVGVREPATNGQR